MATRVVIADDHQLFREGLKAIINTFKGIKVIGDVSNAEELLDFLKASRPDVILLDLSMPGTNGFDVLTYLKKTNYKAKALVISMFVGDNYISKAIECGASGYLHKNAAPAEIETAINSVVENGYYFNENINKALLQGWVKKKNLDPVFQTNGEPLTDTEITVIKCICAEMTSSEIAEKVFLSKRTVEGIRQQLISKTGSKNVVGLVLYAAKNGIVKIK